MLDSVIAWSLRNRLLVLLGAAALSSPGAASRPPACRWMYSPI